MAIQALKEIGKGNVAESEMQIILKQLAKEEPFRLEHDIRLAPEWIRIIMRKALKDKINSLNWKFKLQFPSTI